MKKTEFKFDAVIVGGGPAGLMSALLLSRKNLKVAIVEQNKEFGKKLLITGKGRCNFLNDDLSLKNFSHNGRFLTHSSLIFPKEKILDFFEKNIVSYKLERGGRYFPKSDKAKTVLNALVRELMKNKVNFIKKVSISSYKLKENKIEALVSKEAILYANHFIIATGGKSYPQTGSKGKMFPILEKMGHSIKPLKPALVPVITKEEWVKKLSGVSLKNVRLNVYANGKKKTDFFGEMVFTHFGIGGPIVLNASQIIDELLDENKKVKVSIDLKPALDEAKLDNRILRDFDKYANRAFRNALGDLLPKSLIYEIVKLSKVNPEKKVHSITKEERKNFVKLLKNLELKVKGLKGFDFAIVTKGGVDLKEVDPKTMQSKIIKNLSFAGEVLDLAGPTGGYNLAICWLTANTISNNPIFNEESNKDK